MSPSTRLSGLQLVNPQLPRDGAPAWSHALVTAAPDARPLPASPRRVEVEIAGAGRLWSLDDWLAETHGTSLVVVDRGEVVHEWYAEAVPADALLLGASMTKSVLAHLVGVAVRRGDLSLDDPVPQHVPELAGGGYACCTVRHLLTMTSGVDWVEDHRDPTSLASRLVACFSEASGGSRELLTRVGARCEPGIRYEYCTADSQVLDWVRERATGSTYLQALGELWHVLGCTCDALVATDGPQGTAMAGGGLAATARDWARVALLQGDGTHGGTRVLDPEWVERSSAPSLPFLAPGRLPSSITTHAGFGYHWWPLDDRGRRVTADGSRGQFAYVDRDLDVVVVKTSQWPYADWLADRQCRDLSYLGLPEVARAAVATRPEEKVAERVVTPLEGRPSPAWDPDAAVPAPLRLHRCTVAPQWVDYNAHMSESCYLLVFGDNADAFFRYLGIDEDYRAQGQSLYTVETHLHHRREAAEGEPLSLSLQVLDHDARRVHIYHEMRHGDTEALVASAEQLLVHVDTTQGRACEMPRPLRDRLAAVAAAHAALPRPSVVGRPMRIDHAREGP